MQLSELVFDRKGSGEPLVLIHGIGHRRQAWQPIFELLAESYDVIALDLAGFGESPSYPEGVAYSMDAAAEDLAANFEAWGIEQPHVVGNSLGGAIALELGARGLASSVTVLSPAGFFGRYERLHALSLLSLMQLTSHLPSPVIRAISETRAGRYAIGYLLYAHPERATAEVTYGDALGLRNARAFYPTVKAGLGYAFNSPVSVPTTVAWGDKDRLLLPRQARVARRMLPNATHVPLPDSGHVPMIDSPDLIVSLIAATVAQAQALKAA